ncbi:phosphoribosyl-ATP pyrophosphohydrolase [Virgibacillus indicus]|uniref:Phosphoribosyl-ATP pyrophosphohydrolase n=1 Tax=Virgibacillus indicus TaxID=2024554 RepID=A0A265NDU7_9BACI|nr:nucleoside triphosphate pyrophosphohydrolase [Virgibacillus indicus]OZU89634.1 phosphoribosyl-ATP pyrophosphohydrolase [Virgibacillus indicus]
MSTYNKLVRDRIPEIIKKSGKELKTETLNQDRYILELKKKLYEEVEEYQTAATNEDAKEELADVLELMHALACVHGSSIEEVDKIREEKATKRGGFDDKIFLIEVED